MSDAVTAAPRHQGQEGPDRLSVNALAVADESPAHVLALIVAADGRIDQRELRTLERLDAFTRLGVSRDRFIELAHGCIDAVGLGLRKRVWLCTAYLDALLDEVDDCRNRLFVCRLAAAVLVADGRVTRGERVVYERVLCRWHISQMMVCRAIMSDPSR